MKEYTKSTGWYWFCEHHLPSGKKCKVTKFNVKTEKEIDEIIRAHMAMAHNTN